jgi:hypothetical protein
MADSAEPKLDIALLERLGAMGPGRALQEMLLLLTGGLYSVDAKRRITSWNEA